jgi:glycosyltransferase involved in cell wall biosynthesis
MRAESSVENNSFKTDAHDAPHERIESENSSYSPRTRMPPPRPVLLMIRELGIGGSERQVTEMAKRLDRSHFEPLVACFRREGIRVGELEDAGVPVVELPLLSFRSPWRAAWKLRQLIRERMAVVHPFDTPTVLFGIPVAVSTRVPLVLSSQRGERSFFGPGYRRALGCMDRLSDGIVVNSMFVRNELEHKFGVPSNKLHLCYNGIDTEIFNPTGRGKISQLEEATTVIGTVSALRREKSVITLVRAFAGVHTRAPGARLLIIGSGEAGPELQSVARELGIASKCVFLPTTASVVEYYRSIDIFVLPSLTEAFSNALLEAIACGCFPVATGVGGNPELVQDGVNGRLFKPGDVEHLTAVLLDVLRDPEACLAKSSVSLSMLRTRFSVEVAARRMSDLYDRLLADVRSYAT